MSVGAYYRLPDAARRLRELWGLSISPSRLQAWVRIGRVPALRLPCGWYLISDETLCRLAEEGELRRAGDRAA